ncbi:putative oxidoreductase of the aldo/keto reductase family [Treponema sp. JC4]|uniref:aldo/keto reductase n=1 Tax=Treponema sp. JC4 TaxID=1124982 RepID=UPI00025B0AF0|nr:aldo/keto reductase [Treponema sp. JC4]EID84417.1 putative oxidoreductase of the aldo/keto reductase family [Treponema sp. JC4]
MSGNPFKEVKKNFGFGCMRLPLKEDGSIDDEHFCKMVDEFIAQGFNYFDTAHGYHEGESEKAIKRCLTSRHARSEYTLTNKLTDPYFSKKEDIAPFVQQQLELCGVEYFDFYLAHALNKRVYPQFVECDAFNELIKLKEAGKIHHIGISFHDDAAFLDKILSEQPAIEVVQIQFNYADYDDPGIQSRLCYEVCEKYNKPVIIMEPVKGGGLVNLPDQAKKVLDSLGNNLSYASYAIRFAASYPLNFMVLSGMGSMEMMKDNLSYMKDFKPLSKLEMNAVFAVRDILHGLGTIPCTACHYCTERCPKKILIPDLFSDYNSKAIFKNPNSDGSYAFHTSNNGKASDCIKCGLCEKSCPQKLPVRQLLEKVQKIFEA